MAYIQEQRHFDHLPVYTYISDANNPPPADHEQKEFVQTVTSLWGQLAQDTLSAEERRLVYPLQKVSLHIENESRGEYRRVQSLYEQPGLPLKVSWNYDLYGGPSLSVTRFIPGESLLPNTICFTTFWNSKTDKLDTRIDVEVHTTSHNGSRITFYVTEQGLNRSWIRGANMETARHELESFIPHFSFQEFDTAQDESYFNTTVQALRSLVFFGVLPEEKVPETV